ncbi:MAG TPA: magnesium/cobalt transporter CorA [Planctomycetota bacterium]|nr:magnesium/cobalt transporter CorA [Planctomycetota bacterium]
MQAQLSRRCGFFEWTSPYNPPRRIARTRNRAIYRRKAKRAATSQHRRSRPGSPPGELLVDPAAPTPQLRAFSFSAEKVEEFKTIEVSGVRELLRPDRVLWLDIAGLGDVKTISAIGEIFGLHRLALEDVLSGHQRAKVESYGPVLFIVLRMPESGPELDTDQLSLFLGENFVVSFQNRIGDCFEPVRERLRTSSGKLCTLGPDYLAYALIDATVDSFFPLLERIGERIETLEDEVLLAPSRESIPRIHEIKRELLTLRRATWPQREAISSLIREANPLIRAETRVYLNDCYDHTVQVMDLLETYRELGSSLLEVWLSSVSNRMNEVMKILTIISTIFMPLTFIVGVYGMNFKHMPEINSKWGYPVVMLVMLVIALAMVHWFKRKGWFKALQAQQAPPPREEQ